MKGVANNMGGAILVVVEIETTICNQMVYYVFKHDRNLAQKHIHRKL